MKRVPLVAVGWERQRWAVLFRLPDALVLVLPTLTPETSTGPRTPECPPRSEKRQVKNRSQKNVPDSSEMEAWFVTNHLMLPRKKVL